MQREHCELDSFEELVDRIGLEAAKKWGRSVYRFINSKEGSSEPAKGYIRRFHDSFYIYGSLESDMKFRFLVDKEGWIFDDCPVARAECSHFAFIGGHYTPPVLIKTGYMKFREFQSKNAIKHMIANRVFKKDYYDLGSPTFFYEED